MEAEEVVEKAVETPKGGKGGKKGGKPAAEEEDLDALLAEFGVKAEPKAEPAGGKGKKKKGKGGGKPAAEEEDLDALLAEFGAQPAAPAADTAAAPAGSLPPLSSAIYHPHIFSRSLHACVAY